MDIKLIHTLLICDFVLEHCNFVWILNSKNVYVRNHYVLEHCNFVWILNIL